MEVRFSHVRSKGFLQQRKIFVTQRDFRTAADECLRMLQGFRVVVDHDDHEFGTWLKCKVESFRGKAMVQFASCHS